MTVNGWPGIWVALTRDRPTATGRVPKAGKSFETKFLDVLHLRFFEQAECFMFLVFGEVPDWRALQHFD
jgi:hypothetical protein